MSAGTSPAITRNNDKTTIQVGRFGNVIKIDLTNNELTGYLQKNKINGEKSLSASQEDIVQIKREILKWIIYANKYYSERIRETEGKLT